jgi:hypothetical protein
LAWLSQGMNIDNPNFCAPLFSISNNAHSVHICISRITAVAFLYGNGGFSPLY